MPVSQELGELYAKRLTACQEVLEVTRRVSSQWDGDNANLLLSNLAERETAFRRLNEIEQTIRSAAQESGLGQISWEMIEIAEATAQVLREINKLDSQLVGDLTQQQNMLAQSLEDLASKQRLAKSFHTLAEDKNSKFFDAKT